MKHVLITGAASGLGASLAKVYAAQGWSVCLADIHNERGQALAEELNGKSSGEVFYQHLNVTVDDDWKEAVKEIRNRWSTLDALVNNAGVAGMGPIDEQSPEDFQWVVDINVMGVARGCHYFTPMLKDSKGTLINVASMAGHLFMPAAGSYNASKAAVVALSDTLQTELKPFGITVSVLCPAFFKTNLTETMRVAGSTDKRVRQVHKVMDQSALSADDIAQITYDESNKGTFYIMPHAKERYLWRVKRLSPWLYHQIIAYMSRPKRKTPEHQAS